MISKRNEYNFVNHSYIFIISLLSFIAFITKVKTGYHWPAMDMFTFFERHFHSNYLINDFYTNAITFEPNPRWIFGYLIIFISELLNLEWYTTIYSLTVLLVILMPALFYMAIYAMIQQYLKKDKLEIAQLILMFGVIAVIYWPISAIFSIAWWPPLLIQATPQNLSLTFALTAIVFLQYDKRRFIILSGCFFAFACFLHPALGMFAFTFYIIGNLPFIFKDLKKYLYLFIFSIFSPCLCIILIFEPSISIDTMDFINIYAKQMHSPHYVIGEFGSLTSFSWIYSMYLIILLLLIPTLYFLKRNLMDLFIICIFFIISYLMAILLQYIFIEIIPSKTIASIGPVRFTMFGYWMIVFAWCLFLSNIKFLRKFTFNYKHRSAAKLSLITVLYAFLGFSMIDDPKEAAYKKHNDVLSFIDTTDHGAVFATTRISNFILDIPHFSRRSVFVGNGFPFNESNFLEFYDRYTLLYGSSDDDKVGSWKGDQDANFYRNLTPKDFYRISKIYQLDYVLIEKDYISSFDNYKPVFTNEILNIYKVSDF